ncbi:hypothetical protein CB1_001408025 [Camelus ferus]|nr:hypothetical protein CB1_001408025 [Camelus ferus]
MEFHEHLHSIGTKEGLKERKLQKAVESFTWNITILKVRCANAVCFQQVSSCQRDCSLVARYQPLKGVVTEVQGEGQADLLKYAKNETLENLKQIHYAAVSCGLNKPGTENADVHKPRRSLEVIPEKANDETGE